MTSANSQPLEMPKIKPPALNLYILSALVLVMAVAGGALVLGFTKAQENRELTQWQNKLNLIADSRASDVQNWVDTHFKELAGVASNPSLQLYLTELQSNLQQKPALTEEPAQLVFLRNLLLITADRMGFLEKGSDELKSINANVRAFSGTGLAIVDTNGKVTVSTEGMSTLDSAVLQKIADAPKGEASLIDIFTAPNGVQQMGFVLPIYPIQGEAVAAQQVGKLVGIKKVDENLFKHLRHPGVTDKTLEAVLLRKEGGNVSFLSPFAGKNITATKFSVDTPDLDAGYALTSVGSFSVKRDYDAQATLMTSRAIAQTPWVLMLHISKDEAMAESDQWRRQTEYIMFFALLAAISSLIAVWYYGTTKRTMMLSMETSRLAARLAAEEKLLRVVADNQLEPIIIVDGNNVAQFANDKAAQALRQIPLDIVGKDLTALWGAVRADEYAEANKAALVSMEPFVRTWRMEADKGIRIMQSAHIPLKHIPIDRLPNPTPGVLMIDQDVTEVVTERERRVSLLQQLINALVKMVDQRDHHAANHSACVAHVAREIAQSMNLPMILVDTAETAGKLMNIGKIVVPTELLTKPSVLDENEIKFIRKSLQQSADLIQDIPFEGPVVDTLRQVQERFDGLGPLMLHGDNILITARIIAVANAFIGMISTRSYREGMEMGQAIKILLQDRDSQFDFRVIVSLANYIENKQGQEALKLLVSRV